MRIVSSLVVLSLVLLVAVASPARADDTTDAARAVISAQEQAFGRDDAPTAFSYASPGVVNIFHTPDIFMSMVRRAYGPVYRHKSFVFGSAQVEDSKITQTVNIVDADGVPWEAVYTLETQSDGSLKISSCKLKKFVEA
jgi:hypothetical protein